MRSGIVPSGGNAPPPSLSAAALREAKASILINELKLKGGGGGVPGAAAAARLGAVAPVKGKKVIQQQAVIPGMEPAEEPPNLPRAQAAKQQGNRQFNLHDEATAFPSLNSFSNGNSSAIKPAPNQGSGGPAHHRAINAVHKSDSTGFITDLSRYNALLNGGGISSDGDDDKVDDFFSADGSQLSGPASQADFDPIDIDDQILMFAVQYGLEAAGLDERYEDYVATVRDTLQKELDLDHAKAYEEAERVVLEAERAEAEAVAAAAAAAEAAAAQQV